MVFYDNMYICNYVIYNVISTRARTAWNIIDDSLCLNSSTSEVTRFVECFNHYRVLHFQIPVFSYEKRLYQWFYEEQFNGTLYNDVAHKRIELEFEKRPKCTVSNNLYSKHSWNFRRSFLWNITKIKRFRGQKE